MGKSGKPGFYAVARGRVPGIYSTWDECQAQTAGFAGNKHQKFSSLEQARQYLAQNGVAAPVPPPSATAASAVASSSRNIEAGSSKRGRTHGTKPYARIKSPQSSSAASGSNTRNSQWAALAQEIIEDESGWDVVYSDGACKGNGKTGAIAGVGVWWAENDPRNLAERCPGAQTNNRAELIAIVRVLETTPLAKRPLLIKTDSKYSISCKSLDRMRIHLDTHRSSGFRHWMPKWIANSFRTSSGEPVKNAPLIRYLSALLDERARHGQKVHLQYIKGHAGHEGNEGADRMANLGATLPIQPERDWQALMIAEVCVLARVLLVSVIVEAQQFAGRASGPVAMIVPSTSSASMSNAELKEYAACLADDAEWLQEVAQVM
ncbi:ribonuclease H-like protein [Trametes sanguinea]|nr:ribonuclease H-like protein [Trametes sanguinea]